MAPLMFDAVACAAAKEVDKAVAREIDRAIGTPITNALKLTNWRVDETSICRQPHLFDNNASVANKVAPRSCT